LRTGSSSEGKKASSIFQAFPIRSPANLTVNKILFSLAPWGGPFVAGLRGHAKEDKSQERVLVGYEWPTPIFSTIHPLEKQEKERVHLCRLVNDYRLASGKGIYSNMRPAENPPDFRCSFEDKDVAADCTQFTLPHRRLAQGLFENVRASLLNEQVERYSSLAGYSVYMWFNDPIESRPDLPHKRHQSEKIAHLLDDLAHYSPNPETLLVEGFSMPERAPNMDIHRTDAGGTFYAAPMEGAVPATNFFHLKGFELGLAYTTIHSREDGWEEVNRLIRNHDKREIDHLVITVGGPNEGGLSYIAEEVIFEFMLEKPPQRIPTSNLSKVLAHFWSTGLIVELYPSIRILSEKVYPGGFSAPFYSARKT
jgi:hypothetical protein